MADGRFREVRTAAAVSVILDGGATPVDMRDATSFDAGHMAGAVNVAPLDMVMFPAVHSGIPMTATLVLYGAGGADANEVVAAFILESSGYTNVVYYTGGWADWSAD
ncbi:MAG: rhodanese-like domain-containing protein [Planctomycetota bacterium]